ncbi:hypothetical protein, partial [Burkholderia cenocepacia]
ISLRPLDPLLHLPPLRLGEKVSTYFRMGQICKKGRLLPAFFHFRRSNKYLRSRQRIASQPHTLCTDEARGGRRGSRALPRGTITPPD